MIRWTVILINETSKVLVISTTYTSANTTTTNRTDDDPPTLFPHAAFEEMLKLAQHLFLGGLG
jgi:hypothetical protein